MKSRKVAVRGTVLCALVGALIAPAAVQSQTMDQYYAVPPFVADQAAPNIIILMDNSGSMSNRACEAASCGVLPGGVPSTVTTFVATTRYNGFADSLLCYTWDATDNRFENGAVKAALNTACPGTQYDGNFINWATFRRFDAVKKAMTGGNCWHPTVSPVRNADGTCKPSGTPSLPTVKAQNLGTSLEVTPAIPSAAGPAFTPTNVSYQGRIPTAVYAGNPANIFVQFEGDGDMCFDDDNGGGCPDGGAFAETELNEIAFAQYSEPTGVIQQIGAQARFGLVVFNNDASNNGIRVLTGVGSRQSIDFTGTNVETFNNNTAAMIDAIDESFPATWTPLAESLYEVARYVAQVNSSFYPTQYVFPIAYSGGTSNGVSFGNAGAGGIGASEISALTGSEVCPAGYISNACGRDPYFYGSNHTPAWATTSTQVRCCKTFVIVFTDGQPTQDLGIPAGINQYANVYAQPYAGTYCTGNRGVPFVDPPLGTCNNDPATPTNVLLKQHRTDYTDDGTHFLNDVAYWAHINDLRPCNGTAPALTDGTISALGVTGHCLDGLQNLSVYTFYAFGTIAARELLMHTARLGGFEDSDKKPSPCTPNGPLCTESTGYNLPDKTAEWDKVINATGAPGTDGIPDTYFESANVDDLQDRLMAAITAILRKSSSGTAISVLATSASGEGSVYQAYFYTSTVGQGGANVRWTGYAQGLFIDHLGNFREDTDQDGRLVYDKDYIVKTRYDNVPSSPTYLRVLVDKYVDANNDGSADSTTPTFSALELKDIRPFWEGGTRLANLPSTSRNLLTWVDSDNDGLVDVGEQMQFSTANSATLRPYLRAVVNLPLPAPQSPYTADNIINFVRGDEIAGLRTRMLEVPVGSGSFKVWKLGDPIHSTPTIVTAPRSNYDLVYGDSSYTAFYTRWKDRREVVYVGANDGMLHAFNGGYYHKSDDVTTTTKVEHGWYTNTPTLDNRGQNLGDELWGFIPYQLLPQLQWLTRADYTHVYYVDLKPTVADVRIFTPDADHPNGWGTVLIGGFRMGGSCGRCASGTGAQPMTVTADFGSGVETRDFYSAYFVLDITNPEVDPKLLWSYSDVGLGLTTVVPAVMRVSPTADAKTDNTNAKWMVLFGSGPNGYSADLSSALTQPATLYAVDLKVGPGAGNSEVTNAKGTKMPVGVLKSFLSNITVLDRDFDYRTDVAYFGRTLHDGSLPWRGKMYRLTTGGCTNAPCSSLTWGVNSGGNRSPTEMIDTFIDYTASTSATVQMGPMTTAPSVTIDDANKVWVFFGTGRYLSNSDKTNPDQQYLFGVKDSVMNSDCTQSNTTNCQTDDLVNTTNAVVCVVCAPATNQMTDPNNPALTDVTTGANSLAGLVQSKDGWYVKLVSATGTSAERSVSTSVVLAGAAFFPTLIPSNDFCASDGQSYLYALYYKTGSAYPTPIIGTSASGANTISNTRIGLGEGVASQIAIHIDGTGNLPGGPPGGPPIKACSQMSTGSSTCVDANAPNPPWNRYLSWERDRN